MTIAIFLSYASIEYGIKEKITFAPSCVILKGKTTVEK